MQNQQKGPLFDQGSNILFTGYIHNNKPKTLDYTPNKGLSTPNRGYD
jgi:hypothetical protein